MISETAALKILLDRAHPVAGIEEIATGAALGRVLARDLRATSDIPAGDTSAMDGYAIRTRDLIHGNDTWLAVTQRIPAGATGNVLTAGTAARIFTGAQLPPGSDAVLPQEVVRATGGQIHLSGPVEAGLYVRKAGEDVTGGAVVLSAGVRLRPQHLGLIAALGLDRVAVRRPLRAAMFCTGDELVAPGAQLTPGKIYNSNAHMLQALLETLGCEVNNLGHVPDDTDATCEALATAASGADIILTSGGVSVGEEDHVKAAVTKAGRLELWQVAVKPGKPLVYGSVEDAHFFGLPGNPVSLFVTFCIFVRPFLLKLQGRTDLAPRALPALAEFERTNPIQRREYLRARLTRDERGRSTVSIFPNQSSGALSSTTWADCFAVIPEQATVQRGQTVDVIPYAELLY